MSVFEDLIESDGFRWEMLNWQVCSFGHGIGGVGSEISLEVVGEWNPREQEFERVNIEFVTDCADEIVPTVMDKDGIPQSVLLRDMFVVEDMLVVWDDRKGLGRGVR